MNALANKLVFTAMMLSLGSCITGTDLPSEAESEEEEIAAQAAGLSSVSPSYVVLRRDLRRCMAPLCGGYFVKDANGRTAERYVSGLDLSPSGLDEATVARVFEAPSKELVVRGKLGPREARYGTRQLLVDEIYRGLSGVVPRAGDIFYKAHDRVPAIECFTAPCNNEIAVELNTSRAHELTSLSVEHAAGPHVDETWLIERVQHHDAIVTARIRDGRLYPGGHEKVLDASQVFVRLPD